MDRVNPVYIPRNHLVEEALAAATAGDLEPFQRLLDVRRAARSTSAPASSPTPTRPRRTSATTSRTAGHSGRAAEPGAVPSTAGRRSIPVAQAPNAPLLVAFAALLVAALTDGSVHAYARGGVLRGARRVGLAGDDRRRELRSAGRSASVALVYVVAKVGDAFGA